MELREITIISVQHGQIEDGPYWGKVSTIGEEIIDYNGFHGQQIMDYPLESKSAKRMAQELTGLLPGTFKVYTATRRNQKGRPELFITGFDHGKS